MLILYAVLSAVLLAAASFYFDLGFLAWLGLIPFFWSVESSKDSREAFKLGLFSGTVFFGLLLYWLGIPVYEYAGNYKYIGLILLIFLFFIKGLFWGFFAFAARKLMKSRQINILLSLPLLWTVFEIIREMIFSPLPLGALGYTQAPYPFIIQSADLFGVYGISYLIVFGNTVIYTLFTRRYSALRVLGVAVLIAILVIPYNFYGLNKIGPEDADIGFIQSNIPQEEKWDREFRERNIKAHLEPSYVLDQKVDLLVWPESAIPVDPFLEKSSWEKLALDLKELDSPLFVGILHGREPERYNTNYLIKDGEFVDSYKKNWLVPFGEYIPLPAILGWIDLGFVQTSPGEEISTFSYNDYTWASPICYEILNTGLLSRMSRDTEFILHLSNEAWFKDSHSLPLLWSVGVLRAVEFRRSIVKVANTGYSGYVNFRGEKIKLFPANEHYFGEVTVERYEENTLFSRLDILPLLILFVLLLAAAFLLRDWEDDRERNNEIFFKK